jgi:formate hydrogenlyase transcriptional activator
MGSAQPKGIKGNLLVVDDDVSALQTMDAFLSREGYEVRCAPNGEMALMFAHEDPPELILLDIRLPDMDGFQVCWRLKEGQKTSDIPIIFISALDEVVDKVKGFAAGAVDYITKPFQAEEVLARVETHLALRRLQRQVEVQNAQLQEEIIKSKRAEEKIKHAAEEWRTTFDSITDPVSIHDKDFRIVRANKAFAVTFGMEVREVLGKKCYEIIHATEEPWPTCPHRQTLESGKAVTEEFFEPHLGRFVQVSASPILNDKNEVIGSVHIAQDVTERKRAQEALQRAHDELEERVKERTTDLATANAQLVASEKALEERLKFETLLAEISARFVNLPVDQIDSEIIEAQRRVCELFDIDRSTLWQTSEREPDTMLLTHIHQPPGSRPTPERMDARGSFPWATQKVLRGEIVTIPKLAGLPLEAACDRETWCSYGTKSTLLIPLSTGGGKVLGTLSFAVIREERDWPEPIVKRLLLVSELFANALARKRAEEQLRERLREIEELKQRLEGENIYLQEEVQLLGEHSEIVGQSLAMKKVLAQVEQVARTDSTVLIQGETGTGKELLARAIHGMSGRKARLLVTVNCASLPPTLIESELFGRERGAYTGALTKMIGRFEIADGATLFLDEIGEIPLELQSKLLRVLEEGNFERLGSTKTLHVDVRIITATNRDIAQEVQEGKFRKDLFYRLNVFPIVIPPLRERPEDIPLLVWAFVKEFQKKMGKKIENISKKSMEALQSYSWPGNVRELRNVIEHAMIVSSDRTLVVHAPKLPSSETPDVRSLEDMERRHIVSALERNGWRVGGKGGAAEVLGLKRSTLYSRMKKLGINRPNS